MRLDKSADINIGGGRWGNALQAVSLGGHEKIIQILGKPKVSPGLTPWSG
jgi:hypothetical protein